MNLHQAFRPSILLSETHFSYLGKDDVIVAAIERVAEEGFFHNVEIANMHSADQRRRIAKVIEAGGLSMTYWLISYCAKHGLDLSAMDESLRKKTVGVLKTHMAEVTECGSRKIALASGPDPGPSMRAEATEQFYISLCELCQAATKFPGMRVIVEPMDRGAHKNHLIGPIAESVKLIERLGRDFANIGICWDSSHVLLCGGDISDSLVASRDTIFQMHLANAILDRNDPGFGDNHMPTGEPGFLTMETIAGVFDLAAKNGLFDSDGISVALEVRSKEGDDPWINVAQCRRILTEAWDMSDASGA